VFTTSCQSTIVFGEAVKDFDPRAIFTAGMTRDTSPALCPVVCGSAKTSNGIAITIAKTQASATARDGFVFIEDSSKAEKVALSCLTKGQGGQMEKSLRFSLAT
jgi:hypothetical protein